MTGVEVEVLGISASLGVCCRLFLAACFSASLQQEAAFSVEKRGDRAEKRMGSQQESCLWLNVHRAQWLKS